MKVSSKLDWTKEDVENATDKELTKLFCDRIIEWYIEPMEELLKFDHTGWAVTAIFQQACKAMSLCGWDRVVNANLLMDTGVFLSGDYPTTLNIKYQKSGEGDIIKINPHLMPETLRNLFDRSDIISPASIDEFRSFLLEKITRLEKMVAIETETDD